MGAFVWAPPRARAVSLDLWPTRRRVAAVLGETVVASARFSCRLIVPAGQTGDFRMRYATDSSRRDDDIFSATIQPSYSLLKMSRFVQCRCVPQGRVESHDRPGFLTESPYQRHAFARDSGQLNPVFGSTTLATHSFLRHCGPAPRSGFPAPPAAAPPEPEPGPRAVPFEPEARPLPGQWADVRLLVLDGGGVRVGLGRIVALYHRSSTLY